MVNHCTCRPSINVMKLSAASPGRHLRRRTVRMLSSVKILAGLAHRSCRLRRMFSVGQRTAVAGAFKLVGYEGPLLTAPVTSEDERAFLLETEAFTKLREVRVLEQVLQQVLGRKVFVVERSSRWGEPVPFA